MLVGNGGSDWKQEPSKQQCSLLDPTSKYSATMQRPGLPHPGECLRLHPLLRNRCAKKKKTAQMKRQIKAPEKIQLSNKEIANLSDAQFKTLVIRMLTEMVEYGHKNVGKSEGYEK